jgi:hypothetical protein
MSLLVTGDAKRCYIKHRKHIQCFDDFYAFLISQFTVEPGHSLPAQSHARIINPSCAEQLPSRITGNREHTDALPDGSDAIISRHPPSLLPPNTSVDIGATNLIGVLPDTQSTTIISNSSTTIFDQTTNDLRKAIVGDLIKNPKVFRGAKDDVQKWIDDIEHLLDIAHIPETSRLDLPRSIITETVNVRIRSCTMT